MAKVAFSKIKISPINEPYNHIVLADGTQIDVKTYLPVQDKLALISRVIQQAHEQDSNYSNPVKANVYRDLEVIFAYTNISFTEKQLEDVAKLYDLLVSSGFYETVKNIIPKSETEYIYNLIYKTASDIIAYRNSAVGIMEALSQDYKNLEFDAEALQKKINDPESLSFLKEVLTKMG